MKKASNIMRWIALGFAIYGLASEVLGLLPLVAMLPFMILPPVLLGVIIGLISAGPALAYVLIIGIIAVIKLARNKPSISIGVLLVVGIIFSNHIYLIAGVLTILSACFRKSAAKKELE